MFGHVVYDAIRIAEREIHSAMPNAPVVNHEEHSGGSWRVGFRLAASERLHRLADALEPKRELLESRFSSDSAAGC